jgi:two-component system, OmpR family, catabolic regulation response regulator CreB
LKKKILIVNDEPAIADALDYVLRTDGFEPVCFGLGQLALQECLRVGRLPALQ